MLPVYESSPETSLTTLRRTDWIVAAVLAIVTILFVLATVRFPIHPMEDATMLLRYSQNMARGHGIVWNVGEHPVEGATDFLYMFLIGLLSWITRANVKSVAGTILFVSQVASVVVLYLGLRRFYDATRPLAAAFALALAFGLGYRFIDAGFSVPFYSLFALLTWCSGILCIHEGVTKDRAIWFASLAFVTGLIRPDGVILAALILCSTLFGVQTDRRLLAKWFGTIFLAGGAVYFGWRLFYFRHLFPNAFYVRHQGPPQIALLHLPARLYLEMMLPFLPLAGLASRSREGMRQLTIWLITVVPFLLAWSTMQIENNSFARLQYVLVPLSLMALGGITATWWNEASQERTTPQTPLIAAFFLLFALAVFYNLHLYRTPSSNLGGQQLAERLKPYAGKHYTMMVTEAGDIPFYSEWRAIDALGLNDEYIAHHNGVMTEEYLEKNKPEVILYHDYADAMKAADVQIATTGHTTTKEKLTLNALAMRNYAIAHGYVLAAQWGAVYCDYRTWWVRPDFPDRDAIVSAIRDHPYYAQETGRLSYDFRNAPEPSLPCGASPR